MKRIQKIILDRKNPFRVECNHKEIDYYMNEDSFALPISDMDNPDADYEPNLLSWSRNNKAKRGMKYPLGLGAYQHSVNNEIPLSECGVDYPISDPNRMIRERENEKAERKYRKSKECRMQEYSDYILMKKKT